MGADPPRRRRLPPDGDGAGDHQRGARRPRRRAPTWSPGSTRSWRRPRRSRPEVVAHATGLAADDIRRLARELAAAPSACVYGRIGTTTAEFGTLTSWLVDVLNVLTGNLDRPGGAMFTTAAAGRQQHPRQAPVRTRAVKLHRRTQPRPRAARRPSASCPAVAHGRGDGHPGRGPDPGARHRGRQPGAVHPELGAARRRARRARVHGGRRHLRQRDHPARRRDPAGARRRCRRATTTWPCCSSRSTTRPTTASPCSRSTRTSPTEWEVLARLALVLQGAGADRRSGRWSTT